MSTAKKRHGTPEKTEYVDAIVSGITIFSGDFMFATVFATVLCLFKMADVNKACPILWYYFCIVKKRAKSNVLRKEASSFSSCYGIMKRRNNS